MGKKTERRKRKRIGRRRRENEKEEEEGRHSEIVIQGANHDTLGAFCTMSRSRAETSSGSHL